MSKVLRKKGTFDIFLTGGREPTGSLLEATNSSYTWGDNNTESKVLEYYSDMPGGPWELVTVSQARRELEEFKLKALAAQPVPKDMALTPPPPRPAKTEATQMKELLVRVPSWNVFDEENDEVNVNVRTAGDMVLVVMARDQEQFLTVRETQALVQALNAAIEEST